MKNVKIVKTSSKNQEKCCPFKQKNWLSSPITYRLKTQVKYSTGRDFFLILI